MENKNNKGNVLVVLVIVLLVSTLALSGFIVYDKFIKEDEVVENNGGNKEANNNATEVPKEEDKNENNNNTTVECEDKDKKVQEKIDNIAKKHGLTKIERYFANLNYCYESEVKCKIRYNYNLVIKDEKLVIEGDGKKEYEDENGDWQEEFVFDTKYSNLFNGVPKKLLSLETYLYSHILNLHIIDSHGDLYRLKTNTIGIESANLHSKPNELEFEKINLGDNKFIDFYVDSDFSYTSSPVNYYISTTEGKIYKLNNIYKEIAKLEKELN